MPGWTQRHRKIVRDNLAASFPEKDRAWVEATARGCFEHVARWSCARYPTFWCVNRPVEKILARSASTGWRNRPEPCAAQGLQGGFPSHRTYWAIGNGPPWRRAGAGPGCGGGPAPGLVPGRHAGEQLAHQDRARGGAQGQLGPGKLLRAIKKRRQWPPLLLDQNVDWYDGEWVDFFGRPACTNKGLALLARATETPVVPYYSVRAADGKLDIYFEPEISLVKTADKTMDIWHNTQNYTKALENIIRRNPEQWFWLHQRWKTKPFHLWPRQK